MKNKMIPNLLQAHLNHLNLSHNFKIRNKNSNFSFNSNKH